MAGHAHGSCPWSTCERGRAAGLRHRQRCAAVFTYNCLRAVQFSAIVGFALFKCLCVVSIVTKFTKFWLWPLLVQSCLSRRQVDAADHKIEKERALVVLPGRQRVPLPCADLPELILQAIDAIVVRARMLSDR